jgi:hypothetical protein
VSLAAALTGALLTTLATPATWPLALAPFLLRGGFLVVLLPIVVLPSPVGLGNLLAPILMTIVFGGLSVDVVAIGVLGAIAVAAWIVVGGLIAATLEAEGARLVARGEDSAEGSNPLAEASPPLGGRAVATRILVARIVAHAPSAAALLWGAVLLIDVAYAELTRPVDVASPILLRVFAGAPEVVVVFALVWASGEAVGGLAARRIALDGAATTGALRDAVAATFRHPLAVLAAFVIPTVGLVFVITTSSVAAAVAWSGVRVTMRSSDELVLGTMAVLVFVSLWIVGLLLIAVTAAWRAAVWSVAHRELWPVGPSSTSAAPA